MEIYENKQDQSEDPHPHLDLLIDPHVVDNLAESHNAEKFQNLNQTEVVVDAVHEDLE